MHRTAQLFRYSLIIFVAHIFLSSFSFSQIFLSEFPQELQMYPRDLSTNLATVNISGNVFGSSEQYSRITAKLYRNDSLIVSQDLVPTFSEGQATFSFQFSLDARLAFYKIDLLSSDGTEDTIVRSQDKIIAGDAFIIQGQSNAESPQFSGSQTANINQSEFIRVYGSGNPFGSPSQWFVAQGDGNRESLGNTGQWGLRMAKLIMDSCKVPVAIFNGAHGGQEINFFLRTDEYPDDPGKNYGRLLNRVREAGFENHIRAVIWHQGERNAELKTPTSAYKARFQALLTDWLTDYPNIEKVYLFQIRNGCGAPVSNVNLIKEAQRQLALDNEIITIMSTTGIPQNPDPCHFRYQGGYEIFGLNIYRLISRDLYGKSAQSNIEPPQIARAFMSDTAQITIETLNSQDVMFWQEGMESEFALENSSITIDSGRVDGNNIILDLSAKPTETLFLTYVGHQGNQGPWILNKNDIGLLCFYNFPVEGSGILPSNQKPSADFRSNPPSGTAPLTTQFDASRSTDVDGRIISYEWDFGDGNTGNGKTIAHTFNNPGSYDVSLIVRDDSAATDTSTRVVSVKSIPNGKGDTNLYLEAECGKAGANFIVYNNPQASQSQYLGSSSPVEYVSVPPNSPDEQNLFEFTVEKAAKYSIWLRVLALDESSDSYWVGIDGLAAIKTENVSTYEQWVWTRVENSSIPNSTFIPLLDSGAHTLRIAQSETRISLDKILITDDSTFVPTDLGAAASACSIAGINSPPFVIAGEDIVITDFDGNGSSQVGLSASASFDADGSIVSYRWIAQGNTLSDQSKAILKLPTGTNIVTLEARDNTGNIASDNISVQVLEYNNPDAQNIFLEAENAELGDNYSAFSSQESSEESYVVSSNQLTSYGGPPNDSADRMTFTFKISEADTFFIWLRVFATSGASDSYWLQIDSLEAFTYNQINPRNRWIWTSVLNSSAGDTLYSVPLEPGNHSLTLFHREANIRLDQILLTNIAGLQPDGLGDEISANNTPPLPVEWLAFKGQIEDNKIRLEWSTASELQNDFFSIEKKSSSTKWTEIGRKSGQGTVNSTSTYSFLDDQPANGNNLYRIRQVDFDGQSSYSSVIEVVFDPEMPRLYPNPAKDKIKVEGKSNGSSLKIHFYNQQGKLVKRFVQYHGEPFFNIEIDISSLPDGLYHLTMDEEELGTFMKY